MLKCLLVIFSFLGCVVWPILRCDDVGYASIAKNSESKAVRAYCQQFREGVTKRSFGKQNCLIKSDHSELFFFSDQGDMELVEELDACECILQEGDSVHVVHAQEACYNYNAGELTAQNVEMRSELEVTADAARYDGETIVLKGHVHVTHEMGELFAERAVLTKDEEKQTRLDFPWINLEKEVRFVLPKERQLRCARASCDYTQMVAHIEGGLHYTDEHGEVFANSGVIDYIEENKKLKPQKVTLIGDVQMINRERAQYALADRVEYFPDREFMILTADERVLFYDKERGMELAAKTVHAKRDEDKKESVQGIGDVRFLFGTGEFDKLQSKFGF